jgi:hypothetical protein
MTTVVQLDTLNTAVIAAAEVSKTTVVVSGQLGPGSLNTLGSLLDVSINTAEEGDLLTKQGTYWINTRRTNMTDGGNF